MQGSPLGAWLSSAVHGAEEYEMIGQILKLLFPPPWGCDIVDDKKQYPRKDDQRIRTRPDGRLE